MNNYNCNRLFLLDLLALAVGNEILLLFVGQGHEEDCTHAAHNEQDERHVPASGMLGHITQHGVGQNSGTST